ncbi:MAG: MraY family glycosyltransferase [Phycisphaerae bacterium]|jgi:UDP-GlcNAc:undecaprenyl-phosphate GlcNAc-1-phosphate transferase
MIGAMIAMGLLALGLSYLATPLMQRLAAATGMLDIPGRHKVHAQPIPLLGGCAILVAILLPSLLAMSLVRYWAATECPAWLERTGLAIHVPGAAAKSGQAMIILLGAVAMHMLGLIDDRRNLGPWIKLLVQFVIVSAVVLIADVRVLTLAGPAVSAVASVIWLVAIVNAFNFLDNMDGLSAGVAAICAAALLAAAASLGQLFVSAWLCLLLGALLGFLPYNFHPARTFMGDAGSLVIGYFLGALTCLTTYVPPDGAYYAYHLIVPLVLMAVPLYDTASVILLRLRERRNPMVGDRRHFSHRLLRRGMKVRTAVLTIYLCTAGTAISASLLPHVRDNVGAVLVLAQTVIILLIIALLEGGDSKS